VRICPARTRPGRVISASSRSLLQLIWRSVCPISAQMAPMSWSLLYWVAVLALGAQRSQQHGFLLKPLSRNMNSYYYDSWDQKEVPSAPHRGASCCTTGRNAPCSRAGSLTRPLPAMATAVHAHTAELRRGGRDECGQHARLAGRPLVAVWGCVQCIASEVAGAAHDIW
jgi:hypothetical protein